MSDPANFNQGSEEIQSITDQFRQSLIPPLQNTDAMQRVSVNDSPEARRAILQAIDDVDEIERLNRNGKFVLVNKSRLADRAVDLAKRDFKENYSKGNPPSESERKRLLATYEEAYQKRFDDGIDNDLENVEYLHTDLETRLRAFAIDDRKNSSSSRDRGYHIRDLAVIRVLFELGVRLDEAPDHLIDIHKWADKYEGYYSNPREEVTWPSQGSF